MFENVEPLSSTKHANLKIIPLNDYSFAKNISRVPLSHAELVQASRHFPIVFPTGENLLPQALLSLNQSKNSFVDENGNWTVPYVPAHIRRYPFILAQSDDQGNYAVCIDTDAPHLSYEQGNPLYTDNGEHTDLMNNAVEFLKTYHQEMQTTERLFSALQERDLMQDKQFTIGSGDNQFTVRGFKTVDTEKLGELDDVTLGDWVKRGIMGLIYAHLHSLDNTRRLAV